MAENGNGLKTTIVGMGGAGCRMVACLNGMKTSHALRLAVMDTDSESLESSGVPEKFTLGTKWSYTKGCGGDWIKGERAVSGERDKITQFINDSSLLIVLGGLGGGFCSGGAPTLARIAGECGVPAIFITTIPFMFEGQAKKEVAEQGLSRLVVDADIVLPVPNDILFTSISADSPAKEAFAKSDTSLADAAFGIAEIMRCDKVLSADFADLREMVFRKESICAFGTGTPQNSKDDDRCLSAVENLLESPLLGGVEALKTADAMLVTVTGGEDFTIGEMKQTLDTVRNMSGDQTIITAGVNSDPDLNGQLLITVVAVKCEELRLKREAFGLTTAPSAAFPGKPRDDEFIIEEVIQTELPFQITSRGYFTKTNPNPVKIDGDDVDIPTFQRKNITIDKGV